MKQHPNTEHLGACTCFAFQARSDRTDGRQPLLRGSAPQMAGAVGPDHSKTKGKVWAKQNALLA